MKNIGQQLVQQCRSNGNGQNPAPPKKKKGRKPKKIKPDELEMFNVVRLTKAEASEERKQILEALKQQHELYLRALEEEAIHSKSRRLKKKIKQLASEQVLPDQRKIRADLKLIESSPSLHHSIDHHLAAQSQIPQAPHLNAKSHYPFAKTDFQTPRRPSRNVERPDYCALAGEGLRKRSIHVISTSEPPELSKESESYKESDEDDEDDDGQFPEVVVMRQRQVRYQKKRGRPRKGMQGIKRHAILQIKCAEGVEKLQKNSEVQMILDKVYGRARADSDEEHTPRLTDDSMIEAGTRTTSEPQSLRKRSYKPAVQASPIVATNKGDYQLSNVLLGSSIGRVNMDNWTNQASISTPDFKINLIGTREEVKREVEEPKTEELTDDQNYTQRHIQEERREKSREMIAQTIMRPNYRKKKVDKEKDEKVGTRKRGRPPRIKRFKKKTKEQPTSLSEGDYFGQDPYMHHVRIDMSQSALFPNGYFYEGDQGIEEEEYYEERSEDEGIEEEYEIDQNEEIEVKEEGDEIKDDKEGLLSLGRRSRASSFSSNGGGFANGGNEYRMSTFFQAPSKDILLEKEGEWKRERMFSTDEIHDH